MQTLHSRSILTDEGLWLPSVPEKFRHQQASSQEKGIGLFPEALELARRRKQAQPWSADGEIER